MVRGPSGKNGRRIARGSDADGKEGGRGLGPVGYVLKDVWRNRSRTVMSVAGIAALSLLFVLFSSMDRGLEEYFEEQDSTIGEGGNISEEKNELFKVKEVMDNWTYLISGLCWILMALVVANTSIITVVERRFELASMRALGISSFKVSSLVAASMSIILLGGIVLGLLLGFATVPLIEGANLLVFSGGISLPLVFDLNVILTTLVLGLASGLIGMVLPLFMLNAQSPLEVLRDA